MSREKKKPPSQVSMQFGKNIYRIMQARSMSLDRVVEATGISKGNLHRIINQQQEITLGSAVKLAQLFDKPIHDLMFQDIELY